MTVFTRQADPVDVPAGPKADGYTVCPNDGVHSLDVLAGPDATVATDFVSDTMRHRLFMRYSDRIETNHDLDRTLVSFQANKKIPFYSWFKYKEGFSEPLVSYVLERIAPRPGVLLDPFAGSGAALFAARDRGWRTAGIEVLPVGIHAMRARCAAERTDRATVGAAVNLALAEDFSIHYDAQYALRHIPITRGAFPADEERQLVGFLAYCHKRVADEDVRALLLYAAFCVLEEISYTRKDGQYLRWDARSGRSQGTKAFDKGRIIPFREAIGAKLARIIEDLGDRPTQQRLFEVSERACSMRGPDPELHQGSCLDILPAFAQGSIDLILTSPPYANRYDYTRTYALELVYLGADSQEVKRLRQAMLSCTVENKSKREAIGGRYRRLGREDDFARVDAAFAGQAALQEVLAALHHHRDGGRLNNNNIVDLVENYFYEMCFVVFELVRVLAPGGVVAMVNDNVRYAGEEVPVDLILSDLARVFGLATKHIWCLPIGKGNSSQQMGSHGRSELRKCVYVWEKPRA